MHKFCSIASALILASVAGCCSTQSTVGFRAVGSEVRPKPMDSKHPVSRQHANLIAHIEHNGLSFSISLDEHEGSLLNIVVPEKNSEKESETSHRPPVRLRVQMRDDSVVEGLAKKNPFGFSNAGWTDVHYTFPLGRKVSIDDIHSVAISIGDEKFTACPFY